jgi:hypothetical protein
VPFGHVRTRIIVAANDPEVRGHRVALAGTFLLGVQPRDIYVRIARRNSHSAIPMFSTFQAMPFTNAA